MATWVRWTIATAIGAASLVVAIVQPWRSAARACEREVIHSASMRGSVTIENISDHQEVRRSEPVFGSYEDVDGSSDLWIIVYAPRSDGFFPQSHRADGPAERRQGRFTSSATFGGTEKERYEVVAVLADGNGSRSLLRTLAVWSRTGNFPGLTRDELPQGLDEKDCVAVTLGEG